MRDCRGQPDTPHAGREGAEPRYTERQLVAALSTGQHVNFVDNDTFTNQSVI